MPLVHLAISQSDRIRTFVARDNWELIRHPSYAGYANADKRLVAFANELNKRIPQLHFIVLSMQ